MGWRPTRTGGLDNRIGNGHSTCMKASPTNSQKPTARKGARRSERPLRRPDCVSGSLHVFFDPVFKQICDLLVIFFYHHRVSVAENADIRQVDGRRVATQIIDEGGPRL